MSLGKRTLLAVMYCGFIALLLEVVLRLLGFSPWIAHPIKARFEPAGRYYAQHPALGYAHLPGEFRVTLPGPYSFQLTHSTDGFRITHPPRAHAGPPRKEIWVFGCSFTHGWSLEDRETFLWLLQEKLPEYEVVNFGVDGYGTLQSLIQFREAMRTRAKPAAVIIAYASFHDQRNTLTRAWRKTKLFYGHSSNQLGAFNHPYARLSLQDQLEVLYAPLAYQEPPFMRQSALVNFVDEIYNRIIERVYQSHDVSRAIVRAFARLCEQHRLTLVVAGIMGDPVTTNMVNYSQQEGIAAGDISVDLNVGANSNLPYDGHPSAIANQQYAQKLKLLLCGRHPDGASILSNCQ